MFRVLVSFRNTALYFSHMLTHAQRVCRLYRLSLRTIRDWNDTRPDIRRWSLAVRHQFDKNQNVTDPSRIDFLMACAETELNRIKHPQPLICTRYNL